jgi:hypothetical protein
MPNMTDTPILTKGLLKYRINELLARLTEETRVKLKKKVTDKHGLSVTTMSRYLNIKKNDSQDIPADVLRTFAELLLVSMEKLFN